MTTRFTLYSLISLALTQLCYGATITATATGQRYEGKPIRPTKTVVQGPVEVFDAGEAYNFDGFGNRLVVGNGIAFAYGTASDYTVDVDTASFEPLIPPPLLNLSAWTSVSATYSIHDEWFEFTAAGSFTVEVSVTYHAAPGTSGDGDTTGHDTTFSGFSLGETWKVYNAEGSEVVTQRWTPSYQERFSLNGVITRNGSPFESATFDLEPGWRLCRSSHAEAFARADARTWTSVFSARMKFSVSTRVTVTEGLGFLSATSSLARYDGTAEGLLTPGQANLQNGFLALRHPVGSGSLLALEFSPDLSNWSPVLSAERFGTSSGQTYSVVQVSDTAPAFYRFVPLASD